MFKEEAVWIRDNLKNLPLDGRRVLNLGSSTLEFREKIQPHIYSDIILPIEQKGAKITHVDMKAAKGVDIVADLMDVNFGQKFTKKYHLVLCTNMLEHVSDIDLAIKNISSIVVEGGFVLLTVPKRYPLHFDPIDNGFRPSPSELAARALKHINGSIIAGEVIDIKDLSYYPIKKSRYPIWGYMLRLRYWLKFYFQTTGVLINVACEK